MTEPTHDDHPTDPAGPADGAPAKQHGDPLLDTAQGRGDGDEGTRHGHDATPGRLDSA